MQEERKKLKKELLSKEEPECEDLENLSLSILQNNDKACSGENTKGVAKK